MPDPPELASTLRSGLTRESPAPPKPVPPDPPPGEVPPQFSTPHIVPRAVPRTGARPQPVWTTQLTDRNKGLAVLRHLAAHCDSSRVGDFTAEQLHRVFTEDVSNPEDPKDPVNACIELRAGIGIVPRRRGYTAVYLGHVPMVKLTSQRHKHVSVGAHRIVCWLTHGRPGDERGHCATHSCHNKACVKAGHLTWDSQQANLRQARERRSESREKVAGALPFHPWWRAWHGDWASLPGSSPVVAVHAGMCAAAAVLAQARL
jgi:hypothetical protein